MNSTSIIRAAKRLGIDRLAQRLSLEVYHVSSEAGCPPLPSPPPAMVKAARSSFRNEFPLLSDGRLTPEEIADGIARFHWKYPYQFGSNLVESENPNEGGLRGYHYKRFIHIFPSLLTMTEGSLVGRRVLDIGCNSGFWSIQAKLCGAEEVLGVDAGAGNIDQAEFVRDVIDLKGVDYAARNVYDLNAADLGTFDVVFFFGLLYHLDKPVYGLERLYEVTGEIAIVDTAVAKTRLPVLQAGTDSIRPQSHSNRLQFFPAQAVVPKLLTHVGFREVFMIPPVAGSVPPAYEARPPFGMVPRVTFIALK